LTRDRLDNVKRIVEREDGGHFSHLQRLLDNRGSSHGASSQLAIEMGLKCAERPEVDNITLEHIEEVFSSWYAPNNMTLIVVGDLDKLLPAYLERTYGKLAPTDPID
ncbi:insulinase family protein, partial [Pseudomonas viridiflava]|uniref:insulinase family protein n=1 Tax=Pseudomonas viridiflava TaxID=33069 RepID=UPI0013DFB556